MTAKKVIEPGAQYGHLTVIQEVDPVEYETAGTSRRFLCQCKCGSMAEYFMTNLTRGAKLNSRGECKGVGCYKCRNAAIREMVQARKKKFVP